MTARVLVIVLSSLAPLFAPRSDVARTVVGYWPSGAVAYERHYVNDREHGTEIGRWEDGSMRFVYHYRHGVMEGVAREWLRGGQLYRENHYERGQEAGQQRMWWPDGTLRSNYVVRDGRRYGLLGAKGCVASDSTETMK